MKPGRMVGVHLGDPNARHRTPQARAVRAGTRYRSRDERSSYVLAPDGSIRSLVSKPKGKAAVKADRKARRLAREGRR